MRNAISYLRFPTTSKQQGDPPINHTFASWGFISLKTYISKSVSPENPRDPAVWESCKIQTPIIVCTGSDMKCTCQRSPWNYHTIYSFVSVCPCMMLFLGSPTQDASHHHDLPFLASKNSEQDLHLPRLHPGCKVDPRYIYLLIYHK